MGGFIVQSHFENHHPTYAGIPLGIQFHTVSITLAPSLVQPDLPGFCEENKSGKKSGKAGFTRLLG